MCHISGCISTRCGTNLSVKQLGGRGCTLLSNQSLTQFPRSAARWSMFLIILTRKCAYPHIGGQIYRYFSLMLWLNVLIEWKGFTDWNLLLLLTVVLIRLSCISLMFCFLPFHICERTALFSVFLIYSYVTIQENIWSHKACKRWLDSRRGECQTVYVYFVHN